MNGDGRRCFIDSNIFLYALLAASDPAKHKTARELIEDDGLLIIISPQVVNEITNNLLRKGKVPEPEVRAVIDALYQKYDVVMLGRDIQIRASELRERYQFSHYDGIIVASAEAADAEILYSEDMSDGLVIGGTVTIVNPFSHRASNS